MSAIEKAAWILNKANALTTSNSTNTNNNITALSKGESTTADKNCWSLEVKFNMSNKGKCNCGGSTSTPTTSSDSITMDADDDAIIAKQKHLHYDDDDEESVIRHKLSIRSYHLPSNTWGQDYIMYIRNNHLVLGLCCHHRLHPVKFKHRLILLLGSLAFGLTVTNAVYLYFLYGERDYDDTAVSLSLSLEGIIGGDENAFVQTEMSKKLSIDLSYGMAVLWTIGAASHALFDLFLWHMIACGYCQDKHRSRRYNHAGWNVALAVVSIIVAGASFVVLFRAYEDTEEEDIASEELLRFANHDEGDNSTGTVSLDEVGNDTTFTSPFRPITIETIKATLSGSDPDFRFLYGYLVELGVSLFVFTPVIQTILFSGIFGCCGRLPLVGGRPRSVKLEEERVAALANRKESSV